MSLSVSVQHVFTPLSSLGRGLSGGTVSFAPSSTDMVLLKMANDYLEILDELVEQVLHASKEDASILKNELHALDLREIFEDLEVVLERDNDHSPLKVAVQELTSKILTLLDAIDVVVEDEKVDEESETFQAFLQELVENQDRTDSGTPSKTNFYDLVQIPDSSN
jgi:hypothetical protein